MLPPRVEILPWMVGLLRMVPVTASGVPRMVPLVAASLSDTVSGLSTVVSAMGSTATVALEAPARKVMVLSMPEGAMPK